MQLPVPPRSSLLLLAMLGAGGAAPGQCATQWSPWPVCLSGQPVPGALAVLPNGDLVAAGTFATIGGVVANRIARWDGISWSPMGTGMNDQIVALAVLPNGDLVAAGYFTTAGGVVANRVARWDGSAWWPLGAGTNNGVLALAVLPNGDLVAGGSFSQAGGSSASSIARWDGSTWAPLGTGISGSVYALTVRPNGELVAGGTFALAGGTGAIRVARWNGTAWSPMGAGMDNVPPAAVQSLATLPNGDVVAGGTFLTAGGVSARRIARWNGTAWSPLGLGVEPTFPLGASVSRLAVLVDGDVVAAGTFATAGGIAAPNIARWDVATGSWSALGSDWFAVAALVTLANGDLLASGSFSDPSGPGYCSLVRLGSTCAAAATVAGTGCASSGGSNTLTVTSWPWVDGTFRATGTGLPTTAIVVAATSVTPIAPGALPLDSVLALGVPGCDLLVAPDILVATLTTTGTAQSSLFLPNTPPLVGVPFYHQMVPIELDALGNFVAITATNALQLTAGQY